MNGENDPRKNGGVKFWMHILLALYKGAEVDTVEMGFKKKMVKIYVLDIGTPVRYKSSGKKGVGGEWRVSRERVACLHGRLKVSKAIILYSQPAAVHFGFMFNVGPIL